MHEVFSIVNCLSNLYPNLGNLLLQTPLLHLQLQQIGLWTARRRRIISLVFVVCVAAFVQSVNHRLTFLFLEIVLLQAV